jgi:hypothetical protein
VDKLSAMQELRALVATYLEGSDDAPRATALLDAIEGPSSVAPSTTLDDAMTLAEAHEALHRFTLLSDSEAALAACLVLDEARRLRQLLRDLVDFDMGEAPERDALCAAEGPRQLARMERAWKAAIAEVGPRDQRRFLGDEP